MKKNLIFLFIIAVFFTGCSASKDLKLVRDDVQTKYLKEKYYFDDSRNSTQFFIYSMDENYLEGMKSFAKRMVLENYKMPEAEQVNLINKLASFKYEDYRYFCFRIYALEPILMESQNFKFIIKDANNNNYMQDFIQYNNKSTNYNYWGASWPSYAYTWIIKTTQPILKKNFELKDKPVELIVIFPNGSERHYSILEKK